MDAGSQPDEGGSKRSPLDNLDKDELVKKCKGLIVLAKNAKQAKDDYQIENNKLKETITKFEMESTTDKQCLATMQETIDSLTQKELDAINRIDTLQRALTAANEQIQTTVNSTIENESMKRQINRLTNENEEIMADLQNLEEQLATLKKTNEVQITELASLEGIAQKWANLEVKYEQLNVEHKKILNENETLKNLIKNDNQKEEFDKINDQLNAVQTELTEKIEIINNYKDECKHFQEMSNELEEIKVELTEKTGKCKSLEEKIENELKEVNRHSSSTEKQLRNQTKKMNLYKTKILEFSSQLKQLRKSKNILSKIVHEYSEDITKWQMEIVTVSTKLLEKIQILQCDRSTALENVRKLEEENEQKQSIVSHLEEKLIGLTENLREVVSEKELLKEFQLKYNDLVIDHEKLKKEIENQNLLIKQSNCLTEEEQMELSEMNKELKEKLNESINQNEILQKQFSEQKNETLEAFQMQLNGTIEDINTKTSQIDELKSQLDEKCKEIETLNSQSEAITKKKAQETEELLGEMRELNEALKNRGDVISKLSSKIAEMEATAKKTEKRLKESDSLSNSKSLEIAKLSTIISEFERASTNDNFSTSSISKVEETTRMRDIEDSFEEKYNKLRGLAIKLKKKVAEQAAIITKLESKHSQTTEEGAQLSTKLGAIEVQVKNLQLLQLENDRLQDQIDSLTADKRSTEKTILQLTEEQEKLSGEILQLKNLNFDSKNATVESDKAKMALELACKEYVKQIQLLKSECSSNSVVRKELETELSKLKDSLNAKESEIVTLKDEINKIKIELNKAKSSMKCTNVLNLEMEAYEKSLKDISQKLEDKISQISDLQSTIKLNDESQEALNKQINILEENLESEKSHCIELKQQIDVQQSKMKEYEHDKSDLKLNLDETIKENNSIKLELENIRLESEQNTIDREKIVQILQMENEKNIRQICLITDESTNLKTKLREAEQELVDLKTEFASYKVRAQSLLRQNHSVESSREKELEEELTTMQSFNENINQKLETTVEQNKQLLINFEEIEKDKQRLQARCKELLQLLDESRTETDAIHLKIQKINTENQETVKGQRLKIDTLNNCYKKQIIELEEKHQNEMEELKMKMKQKIDVKDECKVPFIGNIESVKYEQFKSLASDEQKIDWILTERQEGEGSESTQPLQNVQRKISSTSRSNRRDLIPLDELLNSSFDDTASVVDVSISPSIELQATKDKLHQQESRVKHLTVLLAEAEQDLAKLNQLNDVLKEEMRRNERSMEREKHLHNLEYLKNVVFKFLTINNGDEKSHLVPVLNTILKLSPEETNKLQSFAKGENSRGWGNYLPKWNNNSS